MFGLQRARNYYVFLLKQNKICIERILWRTQIRTDNHDDHAFLHVLSFYEKYRMKQK